MSDKISYSIPEFCEASGLCRSNVYEAIRDGRLTARNTDVERSSLPMRRRPLAGRLAILPLEAKELLRKHRETYPQFWRWTQNVVDASMLGLEARTVFGWNLCTKGDANPRSIRNFPMQANGAEMLRIACCLGTERGVRICAPVHDAILIEAPAGEIEHVAAKMQDYMRAASRIVLDGFELRTDAEITRYPDRYSDPRGVVMWERVTRLIARERRKAHEVAIG